MDNTMQRVMWAIKQVGQDYPYYQPVAQRLRIAEVDKEDCPTACIDCRLIVRYCKEFIDGLNDNHLCFIMLHEMMHYISNHHDRYFRSPYRDKYTHLLHNIAMDMEINQYIKYESPETLVIPEKYHHQNGTPFPKYRTYEEYLFLLINDCQDIKIVPFTDADVNMDGYDEGLASRVAGLKGKCKKAGDGSTSMLNVDKIPYRWEDVFRSVLCGRTSQIKFGFEHRTFQKLNRRLAGISDDIIFPARIDYVTQMNLVIGMDVSGSMSGITEKMYGIMKSIVDMEDIDIKVTILECDVCVQKVIYDFDCRSESVESVNGGGTNMDAINEYVEDQGWNPDLIVIMTDNGTDWEHPLFVDKTVVLTTEESRSCPYKQFLVSF